MSRTIRIPPTPAPGKPGSKTAALLASVAGEEDPGAAVDAPVPPPRVAVSEIGGAGEKGDGSAVASRPMRRSSGD